MKEAGSEGIHALNDSILGRTGTGKTSLLSEVRIMVSFKEWVGGERGAEDELEHQGVIWDAGRVLPLI